MAGSSGFQNLNVSVNLNKYTVSDKSKNIPLNEIKYVNVNPEYKVSDIKKGDEFENTYILDKDANINFFSASNNVNEKDVITDIFSDFYDGLKNVGAKVVNEIESKINSYKVLSDYGFEDLNYIKSNLSDKAAKKVMSVYFPSVKNFISNPKFDEKKIDDYIEYFNNNPNVPYDVMFELVNKGIKTDYCKVFNDIVRNKNYNPNNLERYINFYSEHNNMPIDNIIYTVNSGLSEIKDNKKSTYYKLLLENQYCDKKKIERYYNYYNEHPELSVDEVINSVNCSVDIEHYTNMEYTDLSKGELLIVNKHYKLDDNYVPENLVYVESEYGENVELNQETYEAFKEMADAAKRENSNVDLYITEGYRTFETQKDYNDSMGDGVAARPGSSEHHTGYAIDVHSKDNRGMAFSTTEEYKWISENCYDYGFILRYPEGKEEITGYGEETWHYRYVGKDVALEIKRLGITYEEYYEMYVK